MLKIFLVISLVFMSSLASAGWDDDDNTIFQVVVNHEEQYSIWPADRGLPRGWKNAGKSGTKQECLDYIEEVWTDMRPLSLRKNIKEMEAKANKKKKPNKG